MSKTPSNAIHELIKSLSKSEKRYFKVVSSRHTIGEQNNYMRLFDFIENQNEYNEDEIFKHFTGESFLNKFSITKNRLYEHIMKALTSYHSNSSIEAQIHKLIHSAEILYKKSLYKHCKRQLLSAEKLAVKNDRFGLLIEIKNHHKKLIETEGYHKTKASDLVKIRETDQEFLAKLSYYSKLWQIKSELFLQLNTKGAARNEQEFNYFEDLITQLEQNTSKIAKSFDSNYLINHIYGAFYFASNNLSKSLIALNKNLTLFKNNPSRIKEEPNIYFSILSNIIYIESKLGNYKTSLLLLKDLKTFPEVYKTHLNTDLEIKLFSSINSIEITLLIQKGMFTEALNLEETIINGYTKFKEKISPQRRAYLNFKLAVVYIGLERYNDALKWINNILNEAALDQKEDLVAFSQILSLLIHTELNNTELLPYMIKSTQRFLKSRNRNYAFEEVFIKYIRKTTATENRFDKETLTKQFLRDLSKLKENKLEETVLEYFDFESWAISKIKGAPMADIKKKNYQSSLK